MTTYGTATLSPRAARWKLELEPHVAIRAKRVFQSSHQDEAGVVSIPANDEGCRDLAWFMDRYPLEVAGAVPRGFDSSEAWLRDRAEAYDRAAREALGILDGEFESPELEMGVTPRPYQEQAAALVHHTESLLLADVVGLGKTISALTLLARAETRPALIVAQAHLAQPGGQWETEVQRALPGVQVHTIKRSTPYELPTFMGKQPEVLVCSYHKLDGWRDYLAGKVRTVIWDEVQELRTGRKAKKNAASYHISRGARWKLGLSATPIFNYGGEIFNVMSALKPGVLGTSAEFIREWCKDGPSGKYLLKDTKAFHAWACRAGVYLRRTRKDVGRELAPINHVVHEIDSRTEALDAASGSAMQLAQRIMQAQTGLESMQASAQLSMELRQATGIDKAPYVAQFVRMLVEEQSEPVVVFGWHRAVYGIWMEHLADLRPAMYTGSESGSKKRHQAQRFIDGDTDVLFLSLRSGQGLDGLQHRCCTAVVGELDWSPAVLHQCIGRVHRDGQPNPVFAYYLTSRFGSDPTMVDVLGLKRAQLDGVLGVTEDERDEVRQVDPGHVKSLARAYMESRGVAVPAAKEAV